MMMSYRNKPGRFSIDMPSKTKINHDRNTNDILLPFVHACLFEPAKLSLLIAASGVVLLASMWLMLSPGVIYSRDMVWDLLFNLEGAWRLYKRLVLHVDFHYPMGTLPFAVTALGFQIVGIKPFAFVVGECILAAVITALAVVAVKDRLPTLPGFLFVSMCAMLVLVPMIIGDDLSGYTFAMAYNRFGWSAVSILCVILFIEPHRGRDPSLTDLAAGSVLTFGLFYLKITYFGVAVAAICLVLLTAPHIRRHWLPWCAVLLLVTLVALAPINDGYRADIITAIGSRRINWTPRAVAAKLLNNGVEQSWVLVEILVLLYLVSERRAAFSDVLSGLFIAIFGFFLLSQNAQARAIPLYAVLALLLYVRLGDWFRSATHRPLMTLCLAMCPLLPLLPLLLSSSLTLVGYNAKVSQSSEVFVVPTTNLQGLAVPAEAIDVFEKVAAEWYTRDTFSQIRAGQAALELSSREYVTTLLALVNFLQSEGAASARVIVIDQVNPLPFILGATPPRGDNLWSGDIAWRPPEEALREADYVAIPRFPTERATLLQGLSAYDGYISSHFARWHETPYWTVLERRNAQ